jgi:DNA (cytosine-5)-methyltransferase 1
MGLENQHVNAGCPMFVPAEVTTVQTLRAKRPGEGGMSHDHEHIVPVLSPALNTESGANHAPDTKAYVVQAIALAENTIGRKPENGGNGDGFTDGGPMYTLNASGVHGVAQPINIYGGSKRSDRPEGGFYVRMDEETTKTLDAASGLNPTCAQGGTAVMQPYLVGSLCARTGQSISVQDADQGHLMAVAQPMVLMDQGGSVMNIEHDMTGTLRRETHGHEPVVMQAMAVRRLTPVECERLQGFPDGYTDIQTKGKQTPDGPRYKALGNSMAVPVMAWIGQRIQAVEVINAP